ncbi:urea ABC transporter permease subunit UrtB [Orrella marina]|uniref:Urea ABC transporter permease subunit UrtB n=1 Tax=Orrella marina TaxID=2163011 RepID=A0A2R4XP10_9BURK|nr:urea ABC transporter permease subunit UrtB [Orrella marina]AWB35546.1 urea ABC transporter permease subunit UrtB [Orrella marina]
MQNLARGWLTILFLISGLFSGALSAQAPEAVPGDQDWPVKVSRLATDLASSDTTTRLGAIEALGLSREVRALEVLQALAQSTLYVSASGDMVIETEPDQFLDVTTGQPVISTSAPGSELRKVRMNNRLRSALQSALASSELLGGSAARRLAAARRLQGEADPARLPILQQALESETRAEIRDAIEIAIASASLRSDDLATRLMAIEKLGESGSGQFISVLTGLLASDAQGNPVESVEVREAAQDALDRIRSWQQLQSWVGNLFYGVSLGSVLLLAALGLAITFGLMGVINMAHGELLMIGAYSTYLVQSVFKLWFPQAMDWYVLAALPVAFVIAGSVGMVLERTVIRWLYGRPLETLLATWGVSLILMQGVRTLFGAQNVEVSNPSWMSGGVQVMGSLVLSYNRIAIVVFAFLVVMLVWVILQHTRLGLFVRAITQNRTMAGCVGVPTGRIDMLAFGLGSGIAGLAGVALSQLGNVGPDLGRAYIVDSFMVVVLGGVGQLAGTVVAAIGLGTLNKFIEPFTGTVIAKIAILMFIILFVQKRPQGLFAPKGRSA